MKHTDGAQRPESLQRFRYWIEIKDVATGEVRQLPLSMRIRVKLPTRESPFEEPRRETLVATDGESTLEAPTFDELRVVLREKYPDETYERTIHCERDRVAEQALDDFCRAFARAAVDELLREAEAGPT